MLPLALADVSTLELRNVRELKESKSYKYVLALGPDGFLQVYPMTSRKRMPPVLEWSIAETELSIDSVSAEVGGGFIGGGIGVDGAAVGIVAASVANALTSKVKKSTLLTLVRLHASGATQVITFANAKIDEITLRERMNAALPEFLDSWFQSALREAATTQPGDYDGARRLFDAARHMHDRGMLDASRFLELREALPHRPDDSGHRTLADTPNDAPAKPASLVDDLAKLADLHAARILTADEFAAAKARLLG